MEKYVISLRQEKILSKWYFSNHLKSVGRHHPTG